MANTGPLRRRLLQPSHTRGATSNAWQKGRRTGASRLEESKRVDGSEGGERRRCVGAARAPPPWPKERRAPPFLLQLTPEQGPAAREAV